MVLGQRIRQLRQERHLTQIQLGQALNLAESTISLYESNHRAPDYHILLQIANYFEVSIDYLMGLTDVRGVMRYKYDEATPALLEALPGMDPGQDEPAGKAAEPQASRLVWHRVVHTACPEEGILPNDLLLIETNPMGIQAGDKILVQRVHKTAQLYRVTQAGDPMILAPLDPREKVEILTRSSQKGLPVFARVLELRRLYTDQP